MWSLARCHDTRPSGTDPESGSSGGSGAGGEIVAFWNGGVIQSFISF